MSSYRPKNFIFMCPFMRNYDLYGYDNSVMDVTVHLSDYGKLWFKKFGHIKGEFKPTNTSVWSRLKT